MNKLVELDTILFNLINSSGDSSFDTFMILMSDKLIFIPLYIYILYILFKMFKKDFLWIILSISFLIFLAGKDKILYLNKPNSANDACFFNVI